MVKRINLLFVMALLFSIITISCKHNSDDGGVVPSPSKNTKYILIAFYRPNGIGDRTWSDTFCQGMHKVSESRNDTLAVDICPENLSDALDYIDTYLIWGASAYKNFKLLFLFSDECYLSVVETLMTVDNILSQKKASALVFSPQKSTSVCTVCIPLYGVSYLAGLASKKIVDKPEVFSLLTQDNIQEFMDCLYGFNEGFGNLWDKNIQKINFSSENINIKESDFFVAMPVFGPAVPSDFNQDSIYKIASVFDEKTNANICLPLCYGNIHGILHYNRDFSDNSFYTIGMDSDLSSFSDKVPFSIVRHVDTVAAECINQWLSGKKIEERQFFGLEGGYTELIVAEKYQSETLTSLISGAKSSAITKEKAYENSR